MSFLQPYFLFGLTALVIPIIIHLFDFRRTKKVYFSNTRLLDQVKESTRSFYNLKHLLILISRMLFIAALVLAFAQPFIAPRGEAGLTATRVGIFIDNSNSMSNRVGQDESGLIIAKEVATELINLYPSGTEFLVQSAFEESSVSLYMSKQMAIDKVNNLGFVANSTNLNSVIKGLNVKGNAGQPKDVILISDFQKATLLTDPVETDSAQHYILAPIMFESEQNITIDSAFISNPFELDKTKTNLSVVIRNYGVEDRADVPVKLFAGERQLSVTTVDIPANSTETINFTLGQSIDTEESGHIIVEDFPLSFDNTLYFTLKSVNKVNISQITGNGSGAFVSAVFGNSALFNLTAMSKANINYTNLGSADMIILNGVSGVDESLVQRLLSLQQKGTGVFIIPSDEPEVVSYEGLIPQLSAVTVSDEFLDLEAPDFSRPFYQNILERRDNNLQMPEARQVWSWGGDRNALLKFIDGQPYLSEVNRGMYVLASPLNANHTTFQNNALFVPIMYRIAANSQQNIDPLYYRIDQSEISIEYDELESNTLIRLRNAELEFLPDQRLTGSTIEMLLPTGTIPAGHYEVLGNQERVKTIALNYKTDESAVEAATESDLRQFFGGANYNIISGDRSAEIVAKFSDEYKGIALWRYFLGLALLFLLIEALLIRLL